MTEHVDVCVVGGGPAGLTAAALLAHEGRSVVLFERGNYGVLRVGETLGPEVGPLFYAIGAWEYLEPLLAQQVPFTRIASTWGGGGVDSRSPPEPFGHGWHVDRARLDAALAAWAAERGVDVRLDSGSCTVRNMGSSFGVYPRRGPAVMSAQLVDASGRGAPLSTAMGSARWLACDRQVALLGQFTPMATAFAEPGLLVEPVEEGFWYSSPQPDGSLVVVLLTDADLLAAFGATREERLLRCLERSRATAQRIGKSTLAGVPRVFRSDSGYLRPANGPRWCAVGDAAMATDPLGGKGVARALVSASHVVSALEGVAELRADEQRFCDYLDLRAAYYEMEMRWPHAAFWARRRPADPSGAPLHWREVEVSLDPRANLVWTQEPGPSAEAWVPAAGLEALRALLTYPQPAHAALSRLKEVSPLSDRRCLVSIQWLLAAGVLAEL